MRFGQKQNYGKFLVYRDQKFKLFHAYGCLNSILGYRYKISEAHKRKDQFHLFLIGY